VLVLPIRFYRVALSPMLPRSCRYHPSCSVYAMGALTVHGPFKGSFLALKRVLRCNPFSRVGLDPVPPRDGVSADAIVAQKSPWLAGQLTAPPPPELLAFASDPQHRG
jgi:putative membrane protein insertion efficiency factor